MLDEIGSTGAGTALRSARGLMLRSSRNASTASRVFPRIQQAGSNCRWRRLAGWRLSAQRSAVWWPDQRVSVHVTRQAERERVWWFRGCRVVEFGDASLFKHLFHPDGLSIPAPRTRCPQCFSQQ